ncbi:hypothetical protein CEXT_616471 [Caerostris extrusa]|uniref:Uncharacterized protein n=1 Tax=Caerostris extrusa TaxID=172846 RepID=A0AAV4SWL1_CAEEX|nr:hypothetical protein CEXT_616471 [Caerostris extrusa]
MHAPLSFFSSPSYRLLRDALLPAAAEPSAPAALKIIVCAFETQFASGSTGCHSKRYLVRKCDCLVSLQWQPIEKKNFWHANGMYLIFLFFS